MSGRDGADGDADIHQMFLFGTFGGVGFLQFIGEAGGSKAAAGHPFAVQVAPGRPELIGGDGEAADGMGAGGQGQGAAAVGGGSLSPLVMPNQRRCRSGGVVSGSSG